MSEEVIAVCPGCSDRERPTEWSADGKIQTFCDDCLTRFTARQATAMALDIKNLVEETFKSDSDITTESPYGLMLAFMVLYAIEQRGEELGVGNLEARFIKTGSAAAHLYQNIKNGHFTDNNGHCLARVALETMRNAYLGAQALKLNRGY